MRFWIKRFLFFFIRLKNEISLFEGPRIGSGERLTVCYIGSIPRGKQFIYQIYGYVPEGRIVGECLSSRSARRFTKYCSVSHVIMIEINRLFIAHFLKEGFFPIPEWVEFERPVICDKQYRYAGASKSLKSDLNRVRKCDYRISISNNTQDFKMFYDTMYLPTVTKRYGHNGIVKPRHRLIKDFSSGFLMFLFDADRPVAGAMVTVEKDIVRETTIGIADGSEETIKSGVTGALDYHIHQWAADHGKRIMNVGHTRAFPSDGVYFNKRKWMMRIVPDSDGVTNIAVRFNIPTQEAAGLIQSFPFIFQAPDGLHLVCSLDQPEPATSLQIKSLHQRFWTEGLRRMSVLAPAGFSPQAIEFSRSSLGSACLLISEWKEFFHAFGQELVQVGGTNLNRTALASMRLP